MKNSRELMVWKKPHLEGGKMMICLQDQEVSGILVPVGLLKEWNLEDLVEGDRIRVKFVVGKDGSVTDRIEGIELADRQFSFSF